MSLRDRLERIFGKIENKTHPISSIKSFAVSFSAESPSKMLFAISLFFLEFLLSIKNADFESSFVFFNILHAKSAFELPQKFKNFYEQFFRIRCNF